MHVNTNITANYKQNMNSLNKIWGMGLMAFLLILAAPNKSAAQEGQYISEQEFYDELQPYGTWVSDVQYGNVWIPDVEGDFRPYATRGHWVLTDYGNTWVSDYPWGWATFHYGRWRFDNYYGWEWIPGSEWAPAWVTWRGGDGYYGWAPLGPDVNMEASYDNGNYDMPDDYWVWAPQAYITYTNVYNYYVPYYQSRNFMRRTSYINNRYNYNNHNYIGGPRRDEIQRYVNRPVRVYNINNVNRPTDVRVNNNTVNIYRPSVRPSGNARPARVIDGAAYKQQNPTQRIGITDKSRGTVYNHDNANKLADEARKSNPDTRVVRVNNNNNKPNPVVDNRPATNSNPARPAPATRSARPVVTDDAAQVQQQAREQQRQQAREQRPQQDEQLRQQQSRQQQQAVQQRAQEQKQQEQQRTQQANEQRAQQTRDQQKQQQEQARQQADQQRQQQARDQQKQQQEQARQQADQQRQQQARDQQKQQQEQARQQADQQRQQQARDQQKQQQEQARQQADQQRQQQARDQQRQQQEQARQQADQQRQQQARDQQRQQQEQARQQQQPAQPQQHRPRS